jgi:hypothetical protein
MALLPLLVPPRKLGTATRQIAPQSFAPFLTPANLYQMLDQGTAQSRFEAISRPTAPLTMTPLARNYRHHFGWKTIALSACIAAPGVEAQAPISVPSAVSCPGCSIQREQILRIVDTEPAWLGDHIFLSRDSNGRFHAASNTDSPGRIHVLDSAGRKVGIYGNGKGRGPGEGELTVSPFFGPGDTAYVYDSALARVSVWSPDRKLVRTFASPGGIISAFLVDAKTLVIASNVPTREHAGWPLHMVDVVNGSVRKSFGRSDGYRYDMAGANARRIAQSADGGIWSSHFFEYVLEKWSKDGTLTRTLRRDVDWVRPRDARTGAPGSTILAIWEDREGLLWVMIQVPDQRYAQNHARLEDPGDGMGKRIRGRDRNGLRDTIIEVIDPRAGRLLATRRFDEHMNGLGGAAPVYSYNEDPQGNPQYNVYSFRLTRGR